MGEGRLRGHRRPFWRGWRREAGRKIFQEVASRLSCRWRPVLVDDSIINVKGAVEAGMIGVYYQQFDRMIVEVQNIFELEVSSRCAFSSGDPRAPGFADGVLPIRSGVVFR